jgi:hypothetical protein
MTEQPDQQSQQPSIGDALPAAGDAHIDPDKLIHSALDALWTA